MNEIIIDKEQELNIINRSIFSLSGIKKVVSFNTQEFILETNNGPVHINGENLEISSLDLQAGNIKINGKINGFNYVDKYSKKKDESFIAKLFK